MRTDGARDGAQLLFRGLLLFYWGLQFASGLDDDPSNAGFLYYAYVLPAAAFMFLMLVMLRKLRRDDMPALWIGVFVVLVLLESLMRGDAQTIATVTLLGGTVFVVLVYRLEPSATLLNFLMFASIFVNGLLFTLGGSDYFLVPGVSETDLWWRISMFPKVAPSAFFAATVLLVNLADRSGRFRRLSIVVALYFLVLSGIRSALIGVVIGYALYLLVRMGVLRRSGSKITAMMVALVCFVFFMLASQLLLLLPNLGGGILTDYLFRTQDNLQSEEDVARSIYRTWIWSEHMRIASENPIFGVGTFDFTELSSLDPLGQQGSRGSESFLTGLYARVGIPAFFFVLGLVNAIMRGLNARRDLHMMIGILLFIAMLAYGSFVNAYDFVFLVAIGLLSGPRAASESSAPTSEGCLPSRIPT